MNYLCPVCRSKPPHRLAAIYFDQHPELFRAGGLFVHVAPEPEMKARLASATGLAGMTYRNGNITGTGQESIDLLNLPFPDESIDVMYCCHVLNCMEDDVAAMGEIHRAMRRDGLALLQVPAFHEGPGTLETHGRSERLESFGDDAIFRRYSDRDYVLRLERSGFAVSRFQAADLPELSVDRFQLKNEVLHLCRRREVHDNRYADIR